MMTPEQLNELQAALPAIGAPKPETTVASEGATELEQRISKLKGEAALCSSELVSLRRQLEYAEALADAIDDSLGHEKNVTRKPIARLSDQIQGLLGALAECKRKQANAEVSDRAGDGARS